jgi:hypothetical protein
MNEASASIRTTMIATSQAMIFLIRWPIVPDTPMRTPLFLDGGANVEPGLYRAHGTNTQLEMLLKRGQISCGAVSQIIPGER